MAQLRSNELRDALSFRRQAAGRDEYGEPIGAWTEIATAKGKVEPLQGVQENFAALQINFTSGHLIRCRWQQVLTTLRPSDRIVVTPAGVTYDIRAVLPKRDDREVQFLVDLHTE